MTAASLALLFDLDGTLTDNYLGISRSIAYALERLDTDIPDTATLRRCLQCRRRRLVPGGRTPLTNQLIKSRQTETPYPKNL